MDFCIIMVPFKEQVQTTYSSLVLQNPVNPVCICYHDGIIAPNRPSALWFWGIKHGPSGIHHLRDPAKTEGLFLHSGVVGGSG